MGATNNKVVLLFLTFLSFSNLSFSQWTNQNPVADGNDLWSTFFIDDTGWIVGSEGFIKKTTNAGIDWIEQNSGTTLLLKSVQFINQNTGWICGEAGLILKTMDGGQNWITQTSGTSEHLTDIEFYNLETGYAVGFGGTILMTADGGSSWINQTSGTLNNLYDVDFVDAFVGYAVGGEYGSYTILKTIDGGLSWVDKHSGFYFDYLFLLSVEFINADTGFIGGGYSFQNVIYKTTDGGETWVELAVYQNFEKKVQRLNEQPIIYNSGGINSIYFKDSNIGYAVGGTGDGWNRKIYTTTDGGATWTLNYIGWEENGLISVHGNNQGQAWAVGFTGVIFITEDDGSSWAQILSGDKSSNFSGDDIYSVFCINENILWAVGKRDRWLPSAGDVIFKTTNGGKVWKTQHFFQRSGGPTRSVYFVNESTGWAVGEGATGFYRTTDGGDNWIEGVGLYSSVFFLDQYNGWATNDDYNTGIYKSTDGGITWSQKSSVSSSNVYFSDLNTGWVIGEGGSILKSTDGGESWIAKTSGTIYNLNQVKFYDSMVGGCVGNAGTVLLSTDGGESWIPQIDATTSDLNAIAFTNSTSVWIAGVNGTLLNSTDLGTNWTSYDEVTENDLTSLCFINEFTGWIGGMNGTMFKYQNAVVPVELISFTANVMNNTVQLNWQTATETNNYGFEIERCTEAEKWNSIGFEGGHGTSSSPNSYYFLDKNAVGGSTFKYRLKQIDTDGQFEYSNVVEVEVMPIQYELSQNYPNPFNPSTTIEFSLPEEVKNVKLSIYNELGEKVTELVNTALMAGNYKYQWNGTNVVSGLYIYELRADEFVSVKKMVLIK